MLPETRYARNGDVSIAYQVVGDGPRDLVVIPGYVSHLEHQWEEPVIARSIERLASFSRVILLDKRGTGLSDRVAESELPDLERRMDDVRAVMDAAGSERAVLYGISEGGTMAALFAATYPERTSALVVYGAWARWLRDEEYPWAPPRESIEGGFERTREHWGTGASVDLFAPDSAGDRRLRDWTARWERLAASPGAVVALFKMNIEMDVRPVLPTIAVPTLVLHRKDDALIHVGCGRYLAEHIPGAKYVELTGRNHFWWTGDTDAILDEVEEFVTGTRREREPDRALATVLFTDIVGSTERAAELGDRRWRDLLATHDSLVRRALSRYDGREVKTIGDGFLATFDGPARAVRAARTIRDDVRTCGLEVRAGLHTGECELMNGDVGGMAVHIGARVVAKAGPGEVLVSGTVKDLVVGSELRFAERGPIALRGVPGEWRLYAVED
jgi:class 3 adenylate cyclase/alpha-beta hydrolase superfamily lysophospholipase